MSVRSGFVLLLSLSTLLFLAACGNNTGGVSPTPPPTGSFSTSDLNGTYVFSVSGTDENTGSPYAMAGTITANGSGTITAGTIDINDPGEFTTPAANVSISNSSYTVGVDGRGEATLVANVGGGFPNLTLGFVLSTSSHGLVSELDAFGSGSGTLDLQSAGVTPTGSYAFSLSGASDSGSSWATVGNFTAGSTITGLDDLNEGGLLTYANQTLGGSLALNSSSGPGTTLTTPAFNGLFDVFAIDASHLKFIEMDTTATMSGDAYSQTTATIPAETLTFNLVGNVSGSGDLNDFAAGGFMVTDGNGNITNASSEDYNENGTVSPSATPAVFTANYSAQGTGRYVLNNFASFVGGTSYAAYPSSGGILLLQNDSTNGISVGVAYPQTAGATFAASQGYALNLSGTNLGEATGSLQEVDDIAEFTAASGGTLTGIINENFSPGGAPATPNPPTGGITLTQGTYAAISTGRFGFSAAASNNTVSTLEGGLTLTLYSVDGVTFPFVELDAGQVSTGVIVLQSPSSSSSAVAQPHSMFMVRPLIHAHMARQKKQ